MSLYLQFNCYGRTTAFVAGRYGRLSSGSTKSAPSAAKCLPLRVSTSAECAFAVAAIKTSASPGCAPAAIVASDIAPARRATVASTTRMRSPKSHRIAFNHSESRSARADPPARMSFFIPCSISRTVTAERNSWSCRLSIHFTKSALSLGRSGASNEMTDVSNR